MLYARKGRYRSLLKKGDGGGENGGGKSKEAPSE